LYARELGGYNRAIGVVELLAPAGDRQIVLPLQIECAARITPLVQLDERAAALAVADELHGVRVEDPYRWLEDAKSPEVQAWMTAQDAAARSALAGLPRRGELRDRLKELSYLESLSAPSRYGDKLFSWRRSATQEKGSLSLSNSSRR